MDLRLTSEQQQIVASFSALYGRLCPPSVVRAAEPVGFDERLWRSLVEVGAVAMAVSEADGGSASLLDLALVAELHGRSAAPAPLVEAQVAARLLDRLGAASASTLSQVVAGDRLVVFSPRAGVEGSAGLVPGGAVADDVLTRAEDRIVLVPGRGKHVDNLGALPLADVAIGDELVVLATDAEAGSAWELAVDEWLLLMASCLVGLAAKALELGVAYAKERQAFGVTIGTFQAVAHPLADLATAIDGARLLVQHAAWSWDEDPSHAAERGALAYAMACEAAREATKRSLHVHGGYGFIMEQDVQLYFRRARAWALAFGPADAGLDRAADHRYGRVTIT